MDSSCWLGDLAEVCVGRPCIGSLVLESREDALPHRQNSGLAFLVLQRDSQACVKKLLVSGVECQTTEPGSGGCGAARVLTAGGSAVGADTAGRACSVWGFPQLEAAAESRGCSGKYLSNGGHSRRNSPLIAGMPGMSHSGVCCKVARLSGRDEVHQFKGAVFNVITFNVITMFKRPSGILFTHLDLLSTSLAQCFLLRLLSAFCFACSVLSGQQCHAELVGSNRMQNAVLRVRSLGNPNGTHSTREAAK